MSKPFHIIATVVFAFHDDFYGAQRLAFVDWRAVPSLDGAPKIAHDLL
ncbi:hypothetical protein ACFSLT_23745 [Novosphingobium resinovorum]